MGEKKKVKGKTVLLRGRVKQATDPALGSEAAQARAKVDEVKGKAGA